jgi:hypothetical protein
MHNFFNTLVRAFTNVHIQNPNKISNQNKTLFSNA